MFLLEYIIKLLMGNSDTMFMGFVVVVFGYYGWLLWHLKDEFNKFMLSWHSNEERLKEVEQKIVFIRGKLDEDTRILEQLQLALSDTDSNLEHYRQDVINAIKDSTEDIKEIMMILMNNRARSIGKKEDTEEDNKENNSDNSGIL